MLQMRSRKSESAQETIWQVHNNLHKWNHFFIKIALKTKIKIKMPPKNMHTLAIFVEHGIMAHNP